MFGVTCCFLRFARKRRFVSRARGTPALVDAFDALTMTRARTTTTTTRRLAACAFTVLSVFIAAVVVHGEARARGAPSARADVRAPDATADVDDVYMFMEKARAELLVSLASRDDAHARSTPAAPADWIATFFAMPADARRRAESRSRARRGATSGLPDIVIDDDAVAFYNAAREFANANSVTDPRSGRMTISLRDTPSSRSEDEPHPYQWWYDFLWITQRRYIDCETDQDCASIFHRGEGDHCCASGADFWGHTHNSCVASLDECVATCSRSYDVRYGAAPECEWNQFCCKRANGKHYDVCVDRFIDCADYCDPIGEHQCKNGQHCCFVPEIGYTTCVDDVHSVECLEPPPNCLKTDIAVPCRENFDRMCCGEECCNEGSLCCPSPPYPNGTIVYFCYHGHECPTIPMPTCRTQQDAFLNCTVDSNPNPEPQPVCCGDPHDPTKMVCCAAGADYCCPSQIPTGLYVCSSTNCTHAPDTNCTGKFDLDFCGVNGLCCNNGTECCEANEVCCPTFDGNGLVVSTTCKPNNECPDALCYWPLQDCPNRQVYSTCGGCGNGNDGACERSCDVCISPYLNNQINGLTCGVPTINGDETCVIRGMGPPPPLGPSEVFCSCNNGMCGSALTRGCRGVGGNCCACQGSGMGANGNGCACNSILTKK